MQVEQISRTMTHLDTDLKYNFASVFQKLNARTLPVAERHHSLGLRKSYVSLQKSIRYSLARV